MASTPNKSRVLRLRAFALGVSVTQLAERAGLSRVHVSRALNGRPHVTEKAMGRVEQALAEIEAELATAQPAA